MSIVADSSFQELLSELLTKSKLSRETITKMIQQKRVTVGDGYLTEQGALFLVAAELGVNVDYKHETSASLASFSAGQNLQNLECRILSYSPPKTFVRKSDARRGFFVRAVLYDDSSVLSASIWDRCAISVAQRDMFRPGALVKISNAYVGVGLGNSPVLHIGDGATLEASNEDSLSRRIRTLESLVTNVSALSENKGGMVIRGVVEDEIKKFTFARANGSSSEYTSFTICDQGDRKVKRRVVLWGFSNPAISLLSSSSAVTLVNIRSKLSSYQNVISPELHGDDATSILELWTETKAWMKQNAKSLDNAYQSQENSVSSQKALPFVARVVSVRKTDVKTYLLLIDSSERQISAMITGAALNKAAKLSINSLLICRPESLDLETGKVTFSKEDSIVESLSKRKDIPNAKSLVSTIENLGQSGIAFLDVMCLTDPVEREIATKEGLVKRTEITVADHTGQIKVYGWRNLSRILEGRAAGDRFLLSAVEVQVHEGKKFIVLKNYSDIARSAD